MLHSRRFIGQLRRCGMTLLELVLSLSLSALLLLAISMALHIHWRAFDVKRSRVEEAQLASAILRSISDDIRSTLKFEPPNLEGLNLSSLASNALAGAAGGAGDQNEPEEGDGGNPEQPPMNNSNGGPENPMQPDSGGGEGDDGGMETPGGGTGSGGTGTTGDTTGGSPTTGTGADEATAASAGPSVVVGLYGSSMQLQFDISRLPRVDQYQVQEGADGSLQIPSDIKTVVYFLADEATAASGSTFAAPTAAAPSMTGTGRGLMRAESDRAASAFGEVNGSTDSLYGGARLLAAEVTSLQFQYFDGTEWLPEWNSDELGGLPLAIEVVMTIQSPQASSSGTTPAPAAFMQPLDDPTQPIYRMVVQLPVGGVTPSAEASAETTDPAAMEAASDPSSTPGGGTMP